MFRSIFFLLAICGAFFAPRSEGQTQTLLPLGSSWRYYKGTTEPSGGTAEWRGADFAAGSWAVGNAPFYYGVAGVVGGTVLSDMRNNYTTVYLRTTFSVARAADVGALVFRTRIDDGFAIWINGQPGPTFNLNDGAYANTDTARGVINAQWVTNTVDSAGLLADGVNTVAVQLFNATRTSSDILFDTAIETTTDRIAPVVVSKNPAAGRVEQLTQVTVNFSEAVQGLNAQDLLINNVPATGLTGGGTSWTFTFAQPAFGAVDIRWEEGHAITDFANPPNAFDSSAASAVWSYDLNDTTPPSVANINPPAGSTVRSLSQVEIRFSEEVTGVAAGDLLVDGVAASGVSLVGANQYRFSFPARADGEANFSWAAGHGIADVAGNAFVGAPFSVTVDANYVAPTVVISEFMAQSSRGLADEDGQFEDWIEIQNISAGTVNLEGWSLTDDPEDEDLWIFPNVSVAAGARLVVFASEKNRRPLTGNLHTNFKLGGDGEYLALFNAESPRRAVSELNYPAQRTDISYGLNTQGEWKYFTTPTPRLANGDSTIIGLIPPLGMNVKRGIFEAPFSLEITNEMAGVTIRYTTDFSEPTLANGATYTGPMEISTTTVLRAAAFRANYLPSEIFTGSYIFLDQVLRQPANPPGFPTGATAWGGYPADFEMDPEIVNDAVYGPQMKAALQALPVMSICIKMDDMFGAANGIYIYPLNRGAAWERPISLEFIKQDGSGFQINAGLQIQGNAAREPIKNPKHPMRVTFKRDYGPPTLQYKMFPDSPVDVFDTLILRADFNYGWLHWNPTQRIRAQRTRDSWMKDTMRAMGGLASHNRYTHLFINGLYWGIYDPAERPDGAYGAAYLGGEKEDYDVINEGAAVDGTMTAYNQMIAITGYADIAKYNQVKTYLDMTQFIDYMLLHFYVGHEDWFRNKNWYAIRPKDGSSGFKYLPWDGEMMLGDPNINRVTLQDLPSGLHTNLVTSAEYKLAFADRVQKHFFNDGALMPSKNIERWMKRASEVELPIIAESARWGDYRRDAHQYQSAPYELYTRDVQWRAEQRRLTNTYFPARTATVLNQLKAVGLYPNVNAPAFSKHGGQIAPGFQLTISGTATIYYTTDGTDPRVYGTGEVSASAQAYGGVIALNASTIVKARTLSGSVWSALVEATFSTDSPRIPLRFTEIMYNPANPSGDAYEYLEIKNFSTLPMDVSSFYIEGIDYVFPPQTMLAPGEIVLLASNRNPADFRARYGGVTPFGYFGGELQNSGERIAIVRPDGRIVTSVDYDDEAGWPPEADGVRFSLQANDALNGDASDPANWRMSDVAGGTPGAANPERFAPPVFFNEVFATSTDNSDFVEIRSQHPTDIDIGGWTIWKTGNPTRFVFPEGYVLRSGTTATVMCDRLTEAEGLHAPWALDSDGDTLVLSDRLARRMDAVTLSTHANGFSTSLIGGAWKLSQPTPDGTNVEVATGSPSGLAINEWLANPIPGEDDWIEILNASDAVVALQGLYFSVTNQMFEFPRAAFIKPGGHLRFYADRSAGEMDFRLPLEGAELGIYDASGAAIHRVTYGAQAEGVTEGRYPDGSPTIIAFPFGTPGSVNTLNFPLTATVEAAGTVLRISWPSLSGMSYQVQSAVELGVVTDWQPVTTVTAQNSTPFYDATIGVEGAKYFRVVRQQ